MKKIVLVCGVISGVIASGVMAVSMVLWKGNTHMEPSMAIGFASMILAFSLIFVGIKNYRDKVLGGTISFGKAFLVGFYIALIGSTMYVVTWLVCLYGFLPNFSEVYAQMVIQAAEKDGASQEVIQAKMKEMEGFKEMYKNPLVVIAFTYVEILPVGILLTLIAALIFKRKTSAESQTLNA
jgi:hypothetical protein